MTKSAFFRALTAAFLLVCVESFFHLIASVTGREAFLYIGLFLPFLFASPVAHRVGAGGEGIPLACERRDIRLALLATPPMILCCTLVGTATSRVLPLPEVGLSLSDILLSVVFAPIFEEMFARGALLGVLRGHKSGAALVSALVFASMHASVGQMPYAFVAGLFLASVALRTNSLIAPILMHLLNNLYHVTMAVLEGSLPPLLLEGCGIALLVLLSFPGVTIFLHRVKMPEKPSKRAVGRCALSALCLSLPYGVMHLIHVFAGGLL